MRVGIGPFGAKCLNHAHPAAAIALEFAAERR
jgi:hypothetical protein